MPKDHWKNANRRAIAVRRQAFTQTKRVPAFKRLRSPVVIPAGTKVLVGKENWGLKKHTTRKTLRFTHFRAASKSALMFVQSGWCIWVSKKAIGYR